MVVVAVFFFSFPSVTIWFSSSQVVEYKYYIYGTVLRRRIYIISYTFVIYCKYYESIADGSGHNRIKRTFPYILLNLIVNSIA